MQNLFIKDCFLFDSNVGKKDVKKTTNYLLDSYKSGGITEDVFRTLIETLLAFYIEQTAEDKFSKKLEPRNVFFTHSHR